MTFLFIGNQGMSADLLLHKMILAAKDDSIELQVDQKIFTNIPEEYQDYDVIILAPQLEHQKSRLESLLHHQIPVISVNVKDYGLLNGKNIYVQAMNAYHTFHEQEDSKGLLLSALQYFKD